MRAVDLIEKKKMGKAHSAEELRFLVDGFTQGKIPDYQMAAWAMAVCFQGMTAEETAILTQCMAESGDQVDLSSLTNTVDKHSTGGVGDKTTLIVAPLVASLGGTVAKMSGRGLGHTGGTVDKLESIPGYQTTLSMQKFMELSQKYGIVVAGQSGDLAPADKKLYALRDVTATVASVPLIASSIMSKKLAAGAKSIVLDVKCGSGAFMKTAEDAAILAKAMVAIGTACGRKMAALITNMDLPLGAAIGNALEVEEALEVLQGKGPADLREVCLSLAAEMLALCHGWSRKVALEKAQAALENGLAYARFQEWIAAQGGDLNAFLEQRKKPCQMRIVYSEKTGYLSQMDAAQIGVSAMLLGAGRAKKEDTIDAAAGIRLLKKTGDFIEQGEALAEIYSSSAARFSAAEQCFLRALTIAAEPPQNLPLILDRIGGADA